MEEQVMSSRKQYRYSIIAGTFILGMGPIAGCYGSGLDNKLVTEHSKRLSIGEYQINLYDNNLGDELVANAKQCYERLQNRPYTDVLSEFAKYVPPEGFERSVIVIETSVSYGYYDIRRIDISANSAIWQRVDNESAMDVIFSGQKLSPQIAEYSRSGPMRPVIEVLTTDLDLISAKTMVYSDVATNQACYFVGIADLDKFSGAILMSNTTIVDNSPEVDSATANPIFYHDILNAVRSLGIADR